MQGPAWDAFNRGYPNASTASVGATGCSPTSSMLPPSSASSATYNFSTLSLTRCVTLSLTRCVTLSLTRYVTLSLTRCVTLSLTRCMTLSLTRCVTLRCVYGVWVGVWGTVGH